MTDRRGERRKKGFYDLIKEAGGTLNALDEAKRIIDEMDRKCGEGTCSRLISPASPTATHSTDPSIQQSIEQLTGLSDDVSDAVSDVSIDEASKRSLDAGYNQEPHEIPDGTSNETSHGTPEEMPSEIPGGMMHEIPGEIPGEVSKESSDAEYNQEPHEIPDKKPNETLNEALNDTPDEWLNGIDKVDNETDDGSREHIPVLTENEAVLLHCIAILGGAPTTLKKISSAVKISEHTLRSCLRRLVRKGLLDRVRRVNVAGRFGFRAQLVSNRYVLAGNPGNVDGRLKNIKRGNLLLSIHREISLAGDG